MTHQIMRIAEVYELITSYLKSEFKKMFSSHTP